MADESNPDAMFGTIVGLKGTLVVVRLPSGEEVLCRGAARLHRPLGFFTVPRGRRAEIAYTRGPDRPPLIVAVLDDESDDVRPGAQTGA